MKQNLHYYISCYSYFHPSCPASTISTIQGAAP